MEDIPGRAKTRRNLILPTKVDRVGGNVGSRLRFARQELLLVANTCIDRNALANRPRVLTVDPVVVAGGLAVRAEVIDIDIAIGARATAEVIEVGAVARTNQGLRSVGTVCEYLDERIVVALRD